MGNQSSIGYPSITLSAMPNLSSSHASAGMYITASAITSRPCPPPAKRRRRTLKVQLLLRGLRARNQEERIVRDAEETLRLLDEWAREVHITEKNQQHLTTLVLKNTKKKLKAIERTKS